MRILLATLLLIAVVPAYGSMIVVTGVTSISAPPSVMSGQLLSDNTIYGFSEQVGVTLSSAVGVGITTPGTWVCCSGFPTGVIPEGVTVNSYLLRAAPASGGTEFTGEITFSPGETILAIIVGGEHVELTDSMLGARGTLYPPIGTPLTGIEPTKDTIIWSSNNTITVDLHVAPGGMDMIRILTSSPEPADFVLIGSGLIALALCRKRLRFGRAAGKLNS
jgi:hypothetical protein